MIHRRGTENAEKSVNFRLSLIYDSRYAEDADKRKLSCLIIYDYNKGQPA